MKPKAHSNSGSAAPLLLRSTPAETPAAGRGTLGTAWGALGAALLLALLLALPRPVQAQGAEPAGGGRWVTIAAKTSEHAFPAVGSFRPRQYSRLGVQVSGPVDTVLVDVGDRVKQGQQLLRLDPSTFQIEVSQRKADLDSAKVSYNDAELNLNRMKSLYDKPQGEAPSVSRKQYDDAVTASSAAAARMRAADGALAMAQKRLDETIVRAPFNAVVTKRLVDPGEPVTNAPIVYVLEVMEMDTLDLEFSLPQDMLSRVSAGTPITYSVEGVANGKGSASINVIYPALDEATRSFRCRAIVKNANLLLKPGMLAQVQVMDRQESGALMVPRNALNQTTDGWEVKVNDHGKAISRPVQVGAVGDEEVEVRQGLRAGDRVWVPRS